MEQPQSPFDGLLGDLLKILGGQGGGAPWLESARALAVGVATDNEPEGNPDPLERIALEQVADVARRHVEMVTGQLLTTSASITPAGRGQWALAQLDSWRPTVEKVVQAQADATGASLAQLTDSDDDSGVPPIFGQFAATLGPMLLGLQFGSAAGHLAEREAGDRPGRHDAVALAFERSERLKAPLGQLILQPFGVRKMFRIAAQDAQVLELH